MLTYYYVRCAFFSLNSYYLTHITVLIYVSVEKDQQRANLVIRVFKLRFFLTIEHIKQYIIFRLDREIQVEARREQPGSFHFTSFSVRMTFLFPVILRSIATKNLS